VYAPAERAGKERNDGSMVITTPLKSFTIFPSPAAMSLTKLSLAGNNDVINKLFQPRESLVSDIPTGDGNIEKLFYGVG
jgi:hypothetical protein